MLDKIAEFECRTPEGLLEHELKNAVAAVLQAEAMTEQEVVETVMAEISRQRNFKRDEYYASKMEAMINA